jgi:hypothetical protein
VGLKADGETQEIGRAEECVQHTHRQARAESSQSNRHESTDTEHRAASITRAQSTESHHRAQSTGRLQTEHRAQRAQWIPEREQLNTEHRDRRGKDTQPSAFTDNLTNGFPSLDLEEPGLRVVLWGCIPHPSDTDTQIEGVLLTSTTGK